jgi:hypothetical protein
MKIPCEIVVWHILPLVRREIAKELVNEHGLSQAQVARMFGVTDAAISQYLKKKRGDNLMIENSANYDKLLVEVKESARLMMDGKSDFTNEMCRICRCVKDLGILKEIYKNLGSDLPPEICPDQMSMNIA